MRFLKLIIEGYKSFQLPTEIDFTKGRDEPGRNVYLIGGMNGAGKTSVLEGIHLCLYGQKKKDVILKAINRAELLKGNAACLFELHFETDEGNTVIVKRSWQAVLASGCHMRPDGLEEKLTVIKDGKRVTVASPQMWQDYLDATIPQGITQFFFFDGEKVQEMAADEHAAYKLRSSMEAALGIGFVRRLIDDLKHLRDEERRNRTDISDEDIRLKENELQIHRRKKDKLETQRAEINEYIEQFSKELDERKKRFSSLFGFDPDSIEATKDKERRRVQLSSKLSEVEHRARTLAEQSLPLALLGRHFAPLRSQIEAESERRKQAAVRDVAEDLSNAVAEAVRDFEATERQAPLGEAEYRVLRDRIAGVVRQFGPGKDARQSVVALLNLSETAAARVLVRIEEVEGTWNGEFERLLAEHQEIRHRHEEVERDIGAAKVSDDEQELFAQLQTEMENYSAQIGRKREELRQTDEELSRVNDIITTRERELDMLYQKHCGAKEHAAFLAQTEKAMELLTDYMKALRRMKIGRLKASTTEMYKRLASKGDLISDIEIDPDTYLITIRDHQGHVVQKQNLSAGEKEVFAISLLWGLAQTSQLPLPIVIDTPLSRLDSTHRDRIVSNYFPEAGHQVVVLSTDTEVDQDYYRQLEPYVQHAVHLLFDKHREMTTVQEGYFWRTH